ncbi:MAG: disulfide bond formation protein B [bacterium]|nr:disulfide bond formation protein B [bacterium]
MVQTRPTLTQNLLFIGIFLQSLVATLGSLYYSTFGDPVVNAAAGNLFPADSGFTPCELCWFARILMYPIVFISYLGIAKQDRKWTDYILPMSILGVGLEIYHYSIQKLPISNFFTCSSDNPCNAMEVDYAGFITIPFLCLVAFSIILALAVTNTLINRKRDAVQRTETTSDHE